MLWPYMERVPPGLEAKQIEAQTLSAAEIAIYKLEDWTDTDGMDSFQDDWRLGVMRGDVR